MLNNFFFFFNLAQQTNEQLQLLTEQRDNTRLLKHSENQGGVNVCWCPLTNKWNSRSVASYCAPLLINYPAIHL